MSDDDAKKKQIREWQERLHAAFDYNGVLGGKLLLRVIDLEQLVGEIFVKKFHGHRVLRVIIISDILHGGHTACSREQQFGEDFSGTSHQLFDRWSVCSGGRIAFGG